MPRIFKLVSIVIHAIILTILSYAQLVESGIPAIGPSIQAYRMPVQVGNIPLPPAPPRKQMRTSQANPNAAPIDAPHGVREETGREPGAQANAIGVEGGVDNGSSAISSIGHVAEPPPSPLPPPEPAPHEPYSLGGNIRPPVKTVNVDPVYPPLAQAARKEGVVILET